MVRLAMGVQYDGAPFSGWQTQPDACTVQDQLELALTRFACSPISVIAAGRTDAGVHALGQVVHFDTELQRESFSWVRGTNSFLPSSIAVQWVKPVSNAFHARFSASQRCYFYALYCGATRPPLLAGRVGYQMLPPDIQLDITAMQQAALILQGEHDFSAFRASQCQAHSPVKTLSEIYLEQRGNWLFCRLSANAFLHHMVRNIMGCLIAIGCGRRSWSWIEEVLHSRNRSMAAPTFMADGLYLAQVTYPAEFGLPMPDFSASIFHEIGMAERRHFLGNQ